MMSCQSGQVDVVAVDQIPREVAVALWRSVDSGDRWRRVAYRPRERLVVDVAEATISPEQRAAVFAALEEARFFGLPDRWPPDSVPDEGDVVVVAALVGTRAHRVVARPAEALPPALARVVYLVAEAAPDARVTTPARRYWRIERLEAARAERVRRRGLLPHLPVDRGPPLPPSMLRSVAAPSEWMAIDVVNEKWAEELAGASRELVLDGPSASWLVEIWQGDRSGD